MGDLYLQELRAIRKELFGIKKALERRPSQGIWPEVAKYCDNDILATEEAFNSIRVLPDGTNVKNIDE